MAMTRGNAKLQSRSASRWLRSLRDPSFLFILPTALLVLLVIGYPFVRAIWLSFTNKIVAGPVPDFIGLDNYIRWAQRPDFWQTFTNTLVFASGTLILSLVFGFALALALHRVTRGRDLLGAVLLFPWIIPTVISTLIWAWMFNPLSGVLNYALMELGLVNMPVAWLSLPSLAMMSVIVVSAWRRAPYFGVTLLAGISGVPTELYEAATLDGANAIQRFRYVTLPSIRGVLLLVSMLTFVETAYDFALIYILTRGGPSGATEILSVKTFVTAFNSGQLGLGVAIPLMAFPLFVPIIWFVTRNLAGRRS